MTNILADRGESHRPVGTMMRVRLKADGRIVEILSDGSERALSGTPAPVGHAPGGAVPDAAYARGVRASTRLTQAEFAARIGVPIETVRNWEQGKRSPRGPARALLKVIEKAPQVAFAVLSTAKPGR
jgi:putative transcriptional regulator